MSAQLVQGSKLVCARMPLTRSGWLRRAATMFGMKSTVTVSQACVVLFDHPGKNFASWMFSHAAGMHMKHA